MATIHLIDHPLVQHKLTLMRRKDASTNSFRQLLHEISALMAYEVLRDMPMHDIDIETPLEATTGKVIDGKKLVFVSILVPYRELQTYISILAFGFMIAMVVEGVLLGRQIVAKARAKFPKEEIKGFPVGWYAFSRASQPRKLRVPRPRVQVGDNP